MQGMPLILILNNKKHPFQNDRYAKIYLDHCAYLVTPVARHLSMWWEERSHRTSWKGEGSL
jgi:hypothetical protein